MHCQSHSGTSGQDLHTSRVTRGQVTIFMLGAYWEWVPSGQLGVKIPSLGLKAQFLCKECKFSAFVAVEHEDVKSY